MIDQGLVDEANAILSTLRPASVFLIRGGRLYIETKYDEDDRHSYNRVDAFRVRSSDGRWPDFNYANHGMGGTYAMFYTQIARWIRGQTRISAHLMDRMSMHFLREGSPTPHLFRNSSYSDPKRTNCVLCGVEPNATDWWSQGKIVGPCCSMGQCRKTAVLSFPQNTCSSS